MFTLAFDTHLLAKVKLKWLTYFLQKEGLPNENVDTAFICYSTSMFAIYE